MYDGDVQAALYISSCNGNATELPEDYASVYPADGVPSYPKWKIHPLFKYDTKGSRWVWQIGFDGISVWTLHGPMTSTTITTAPVKLASSSTLSGQAFIICNNAYLNKYRDGYLFLGDTRERQFKCMKGEEYVKGKSKLTYPMVMDVKLDGIRVHCRLVDGEVEMKSYNNTSLDHVRHIRDQIKDLFAYLPQDTIVDCELYKHGVLLRDIQSIIRSNVNLHPRLGEILCYIFDIACVESYVIEERYAILTKSYSCFKAYTGSASIRLVEKWYVWSEDEIEVGFRSSLDRGFEGVMLRHSSIGRREGSREWEMSKYSFKRSKSLLKYKLYTSSEGIVVDIKKTKGKEKNLCKLIVRLDNGYDLPVRFGSATQKESWLACPSLIIGKVLKYEYPDINESTGIPQRVRGLCIRELHA